MEKKKIMLDLSSVTQHVEGQKGNCYIVLRGKVYGIRIQNTTALLFMCEGNQKMLLRYAKSQKIYHPHKLHEKNMSSLHILVS